MSLLLFDNFTQARRMYSVAEFCFTVSLKFIALSAAERGTRSSQKNLQNHVSKKFNGIHSHFPKSYPVDSVNTA